jgi:type I restriction enzyme S subunit
MRSNYKPLGKYIREVKKRNLDLKVTELLGLSTKKEFRPSISNIIGTDLATYRIIGYNNFVYMPVTDTWKGLAVALYREKELKIVSQIYKVFEIIDENELDPEYLMMWFRRPEIDRYARFMSHGSAREIFDWEEMCNTLLPVPNINKQREIVKEYNIIQNRITLNQQLIHKLEETAHAIYKQWFVQFDFPDENGKPYKSNDGEMVWNKELEKEIPNGWEVKAISEIGYLKHGYAFKGEDFSEYETYLVLVSPGNFKIKGGFNFDKNKYFNGKYPKSYTLKEDDLIVNMTDLSKDGDTLGNTALVPYIGFKTLLHNQRVGKFELKDPEYNFFIFFRTMQKDYKNYVLGSATGTTVRHTSPTRIGDFRVVSAE